MATNNTIDLHMHSNNSDGKKSVEELFQQIKDLGLGVFSLTDHDNCDGNAEMAALVRGNDIRFISGIEFSCLMDGSDPETDCHILGYDFDIRHPEIERLKKKSLEFRQKKLDDLCDFLRKEGYVDLSSQEIDEMRLNKNVGKNDVHARMVEHGVGSSQECWSILDKFKSNQHPEAREAIDAIKAAGGVAVWAHPLGDKENRKDRDAEDVFREKLDVMQSLGIEGLECCYAKFEEDEIAMLMDAARKRGLHITGGSDYHGKVDKKTDEYIVLPGTTGASRNHSDEIRPFVNFIFSRQPS